MMRSPCGSPPCWAVRSASESRTVASPKTGPCSSVGPSAAAAAAASGSGAGSTGTRGSRRGGRAPTGRPHLSRAPGWPGAPQPGQLLVRRRVGHLEVRGDLELPRRRRLHVLEVHAGVQRASIVSSRVAGSGRSTPRSVMTRVGPAPVRPEAVPVAGVARRSRPSCGSRGRSTKVRRLWRMRTMTSRTRPAISGAPPRAGEPDLRMVVVADARWS